MSTSPGGGGAPLRKVVIAGGTGALGRRLAADLAGRGLDVVVLSRTPDRGAAAREVAWDGRSVGPWATELTDPAGTALVNLAGKLVDVRPTAANIAALRDSRVAATRALVEASRRLDAPLARWVQASTTAIYSDAGEQRVTESSPVPDPGLPQMTGVAVPWEAAVEGANTDRLTVLRTSLVLDRDVPVMDRMLLVTRFGLGGPIGTGRQWMSWIHVEDWLAVVRAALGLDPAVDVQGTVIASAPEPVRNADMMRSLRRRLGRPWAPPTPLPLLRLGSVVLRTDPALAATGRHATSEVLDAAGFRFAFPTLDAALDDVLG
ncbi:DUF1731 domain-containing protein [Georgenia sp. MJ173]|uniref:epimerase n=1 Tax=Georgenia sunbinii TaxID=3117728 RepID=UPI002F2619F8